jgi:hypothetical protein
MQRKDARLFHYLEELQHEIAGDAEDLACAVIAQGREQ